MQTRSKIFQSIVLSKVCYNAHVWAGVDNKEMTSLDTHLKPTVGAMLRGRISQATKFQHTSTELYALCHVLPPTEQIHASRLRYLARFLDLCPTVLWQFLMHAAGPHSWLTMLKESFQWLCKHFPGHLPLHETDPLQDWVAFVRLDSTWTAKVKRASKSALAYHSARAVQAVWNGHVEAELAAAGATLPAPSAPPRRSAIWQCDLCPKQFASTRALAMHSAREHGYKKKARYYTIGDTCQCCLQKFHTRGRLAIHLEKNTRCYATVQACWPPLPHEEVDQLDP